MAQLSDIDLSELSGAELWQWTFELMEEGRASTDIDGFADAAPFRMVELILDELVRRNPDLDTAAISEFRTTLERALAGERGFTTGHA